MNSVSDPKAVGPRIRMMMPQLTPLEARVVETVFGLRDFSEDTALKDLAAEAGVSEAMVVKITKKLGFSGFRDFRSAVSSYNRLPKTTTEGDTELMETCPCVWMSRRTSSFRDFSPPPGSFVARRP